MNGKPQVLSLLGCYQPGHDASGPNQSFKAMALALGSEFDFKVVSHTADGKVEDWRDDGVAEMRQLTMRRFGMSELRALLNETPHDLLLLNGFHDRQFTIPTLLMRKLGLIARKPVILSPRGEFAGGALILKSSRKRAYRYVVNALGLIEDVWLHATAEHELRDIREQHFRSRGLFLARNVRTLPDAPAGTFDLQPSDVLRVAFLGRISPVKNVHYALEVLKDVRVPVQFDLFGPMDDRAYLAECQRQAAGLPEYVRIAFKGFIANDAVLQQLAAYDLLFLPTAGENFGHAIHEALSAGLPVLISDRTPWTGLEAAGAGWEFPLHGKARFAKAIEDFAAKAPADRSAMRMFARRLAEESYAASDSVEATRLMFRTAIAGERRA